jgi:hypothetical protein
LIITMLPRQLKSISASVAFPAFALGRDPTNRIEAKWFLQRGRDFRQHEYADRVLPWSWLWPIGTSTA